MLLMLEESMELAEKMFTRSSRKCPLRSDCTKGVNQRYYASLFDEEWEVFVIKHDAEKGGFDWFTLCCDSGPAQSCSSC